MLALAETGAHESPLREAIHRLNYGTELGPAHELGSLVGSRIAADLSCGVPLDALVPVPLHPSRRRSRGCDQARALAEVDSAPTGVAMRAALHRLRVGPAQPTLGQLDRRASVHGAFASVAGRLHGLDVWLVDDVATTGATLLDAAAAARACGARTVRAYAVAIEE
ncbi:MAG TPA: ComF family protein [Candidatus Limnocylindria bacterium]|nr:ComF family protein [Candidatus Limnocylindria bacterium]